MHARKWDATAGTWSSIDMPVELWSAAIATLEGGTVVVTGGLIDPPTYNETQTYVLPRPAWERADTAAALNSSAHL